jgi:hypothetical protein
LALAVLFLAVTTYAAQAQTYTVTNTSDSGGSGDGSLRGEVIAANAHSGADGIVFASGLTGTITFSGGGIVITDPVDIEGPGPTQITIAQTSAHRVVDIEMPGAEPVTIAGLHIANGTAPSGGLDAGIGGNIFNSHSNLTLANDLITGGNAETDGGIASFEGPLTLRSSTVSGNHAEDDAGLSVGGDPGADWTIQSSTIAGNTASAYNGGLYGQILGSGSIEDSTIAGNTAKGKAGGGLNAIGSGRIVVRNSTIAGNTASEEAGGLEVDGTVTIEDSTIAANHADGDGGGIRAVGAPGLTLVDTIVAGNTAAVGPDINDLSTGVSSAFSLVGNTSNAKLTETVAGSDLLGVDPQLGPLQDNGGPTQTMALSPSSPAVNKGGGALPADQRGDARPVLYPGVANSSAPGANGADIGAFELQPPSPIPTAPSNRFMFGKVKLNKKKGTAKVPVIVPGPGTLTLTGKGVVKETKKPKAAATVKLLAKSKGKQKKKLNKAGKVKVKITVTYTPNGGTAASQSKGLVLKKLLH